MESHKIKRQLSTAYRYSFTRLALNYYTYCESMAEQTEIPPAIRECNNHFNHILEGFFERTASEEEIDGLREHIRHQMEIMTAYSDCCENYEYAINRIERRFLPDERKDLNFPRFFQAMTDYVMESGDGAVMNARVSAAISQLPLRMTKAKFFSLLEEALAPFQNASKEALEEELYLIRTGAMLDLPEDMNAGYEELSEALAHLEVVDYKTITEDEFWQRKNEIVFISDNVRDYITAFTMLEEMVNDLYVMILAKPEAMVELLEEELLSSIVQGLLEVFRSGEKAPIPESITDKLELLEGKQEAYQEKYEEQQISAESLKGQTDPMARKLFLTDLLLSGSTFASLKVRPEEETGMMDEPLFHQQLQKLKEDLEARLLQLSKPVVRAVMARVLSILPLWFADTDDMLAFLRNGLDSCTDQKEKQTSMELMKHLMERE